MILEILENSKNYTCQVIKLPNKISIKGLDNIVIDIEEEQNK